MTEPELPDRELRDVLRNLAAGDAPEMVKRARSRARDRAERLIEDVLVAQLLDAAADAVRGESRDPANALRHAAPAEPEMGKTNGGSRQGSDTGIPEPEAAQTAAPPTSGAAGAAEDPDLWWTYCVMWDRDAVEVAAGLEGLEPGTPLEPICEAGLGALVSSVPQADYGDERLRQHLEDLEWVERTARRHENVLDAALEERTIVPLRLCTLYRHRDGVRRLLREHGAAFREGLSRVEGAVEWALKVFVDTRAAATEAVTEPTGSETRGTDYLRRRQQERALAEKASEVRARCVEVVHEHVAAMSRASAVNPPQRPEVHGRELVMLLNSAHLVERDRHDELQQVVSTLQEEWDPLGFTIELTGPWPPYNFVSGASGVIS